MSKFLAPSFSYGVPFPLSPFPFSLPHDPCHRARARELLKKGRAKVFKPYPFTIVLQDRTVLESVTHPHRIKIDPGSKTTGIAVVKEKKGRVTSALEISHRGQQIKDSLESRRALRRGRRNRKTRYRKPSFLNRNRRDGWLPPTLESRIANIENWVRRIRKVCPVTAISQELVRFDLQQIQNPDLSGVEYQRGELFGFEVKEYLLQKWGRKCAYCGIENVPLEMEHILAKRATNLRRDKMASLEGDLGKREKGFGLFILPPSPFSQIPFLTVLSCAYLVAAKSKGGSNRVSNLCLSCHSCNQAKGNKPIGEFLKKKPEVLKRILAQAKAPLKDAAAVNATRWELYRRLQLTGLPVEVGSGGRTKFNRKTRGIEKQHWTDAACVGASTPGRLLLNGIKPLIVKAKGHGKRQRCGTDRYGFPIRHAPAQKFFMGFQTGDLVLAKILTGKYTGTYTGRIAIRFKPSFKLTTGGKSFDVHPKYLKTIHKADGYEYTS